jgi:hypothetical protein
MFNNSKYWLRYTFGFAQIEIENWMTSEVLSSALPLIYIATKDFSNFRTFEYDNIKIQDIYYLRVTKNVTTTR